MVSANKKSGFTIIELLVSIIVLGLISLAATSALSVGKRIWGKVQAVPSIPLVEAEMNHLRNIFSSKISIGLEEGGGVSGKGKVIEFQSLVDSGDGLFAIGKTILKGREDGIEISISNEFSNRKKLLSHLIIEEVSYYGRTREGSSNDWFQDWNSTDPSPKLIRFKFSEIDTERELLLSTALPN